MLDHIGTELLASNNALSGTFDLHTAFDGKRALAGSPLPDGGRAYTEQIGDGELTTQEVASLFERHVGSSIHDAQCKALLCKTQALLRSKSGVDTLPMHDANDLAAKLRLALVDAGVTDAALAKACKVSPQAVTGWKRTGRIHKRHLAKISELTGKPVTWFILSLIHI